MGPIEDEVYRDLAGADLDDTDMEAIAANAEQGIDMGQAIRHNLYIGWILGAARGQDLLTLRHGGGNRVHIDGLPDITLTVPYPPDTWQP